MGLHTLVLHEGVTYLCHLYWDQCRGYLVGDDVTDSMSVHYPDAVVMGVEQQVPDRIAVIFVRNHLLEEVWRIDAPTARVREDIYKKAKNYGIDECEIDLDMSCQGIHWEGE